MNKVGFGSLLILLFVLAGCDDHEKANGTLAGKINIGPLCPVETDPPDPGCLPTAETFKAYPVYLIPSGSQQRILINPASDGTFNMELPSGNYVVTLDKALAGPASSNLPLSLTVIQSQETIINIEIDTGIR